MRGKLFHIKRAFRDRLKTKDVLKARSLSDCSVTRTELMPSSPSFMDGLMSLIASENNAGLN